MFDSLNLKIPPPLVLLLFACLMYGTDRLTGFAGFSVPAQPWVSVLVFVSGLAVALSAVLQFHSAETTVNPHDPSRTSSLVVTGVFSLSRNPMYLGLALALCAWFLWVGNGLNAVYVAGFVAYITRFQIKPEERLLEQRFGEDYIDYQSRVRRWI